MNTDADDHISERASGYTTAQSIDSATATAEARLFNHANLSSWGVICTTSLPHLSPVRFVEKRSQTALVLDTTRQNGCPCTRIIRVRCGCPWGRRNRVFGTFGNHELVFHSFIHHVQLVSVHMDTILSSRYVGGVRGKRRQICCTRGRVIGVGRQKEEYAW